MLEIDENGFYGPYGGAFIPEILYTNIDELRKNYHHFKNDISFNKELSSLLKDYTGRPSSLYYAGRLSERYAAHIYLKREDLNHTGSHKINNALGQVLLAKKMGKNKVIAETGAGQHGVATATACALMNITCIIFMGEKDISRQYPNVERMKLLGAEVVAVKSGDRTLKDATNEALRYWINHPEDTYYVIGSVVGPDPYPQMVTHFQSVIGEEITQQMEEKTGALPTAVIACVGGGSNAAGAFHNFLHKKEVDLYAVEAAGLGINSGKTAATIAKGSLGVIHGSKTLLLQSSDGQIIEPYSISAGLDYPGIGPLHAYLHDLGRVKYMNCTDNEAVQAGFELMKLEGIIPAIESAHALSALQKIKFKPHNHVVICLSGRGDKDLATYINSSY